jgi:hypothetical protein
MPALLDGAVSYTTRDENRTSFIQSLCYSGLDGPLEDKSFETIERMEEIKEKHWNATVHHIDNSCESRNACRDSGHRIPGRKKSTCD